MMLQSKAKKAQNNPIIRRCSAYMVHGSMNNISAKKRREQVAVFACE